MDDRFLRFTGLLMNLSINIGVRLGIGFDPIFDGAAALADK